MAPSVTLRDGPCVVVHRMGRFGAARAYAEHDIQVRGTAKLEHINIFELLGYFSHEGCFYNVYAECLDVLSNWIYDNQSTGNELSWQQCSDIILYIANGVVYLHDCGVIHMSLHPKAIGIGLDCVAKISRFQLSQILTQPVQEGVVTSLEMQREFAPPEYEHYGRFSVKTDVYSYGVLLLELITGKMCNLDDNNYNYLTASVLQHKLENNMRKCIQPQLINAATGPQVEDIKRCIHIALLCVEEDPALRPTMHVVLGWLRNKKHVLPRIHKPAYITKDDNVMDTPPMTTPLDPEREKGNGNGNGKKDKDTQNDRDKQRETEDVEEKMDGVSKKDEKGKKHKETLDNVGKKRDDSDLVKPKDSFAAKLAISFSHREKSSRKKEKEEYCSCSSSCTVSQLKGMIKDLSEENIVSRDGDYIIYKVTLSDGACIVHRIGRSGAARERAEQEIRVRDAAKLEHINIHELLGYFSHGEFLYMVYENCWGYLFGCIYDNPSTGKELSWEWCSDIILDIADGVVYLHDRGCIHMFLHPRAIRIGNDGLAKISCFVISQILAESVQEGVATTLEMEWGYAPPEYERDGSFSVKTDVYSYGVLLLELITGQMCNQGSDNYNSLIVWVWQHTLENNMRQCIQPRLISAADGPEIEDIKRCIRIALLCLQEDPTLRPTMRAVSAWLRNKKKDLPRISGDWRIKAR